MLQELINAVRGIGTTTIVSCPSAPEILLGSDSATALEAGDTMGFVTKVRVPKRGIIVSATLWDMDDKDIQTDLEIFKAPIADVAVDAAYSPTDGEMLDFVTEIPFFSFDDHINSRTSEVENIGKAYTAPGGYLFIQGVTRGTPTVTVGSPYRFQLQIQSFDSTFKEV